MLEQREESSSRLQSATAAIATLQASLELAKARVEKLRVQIASTTTECQEASGATQALQKVRDLIISLEDCPGAHDFPLSLPSGSDDHAIPDVDNTENIENAIENIENNINEQVA